MLYLRIMQHFDPSERDIKLSMMLNVLMLLVITNECQHMIMEIFLKNPSSSRLCHPCGHKCSYCKRDNSSFMGRINRTRKTGLLISFCSGKMQSSAALMKVVKTKKNEIYRNVPHRLMGPIHALCLQLVATGILELGISDKNKNLIGKTDLTPKSIIVKLGIVNGEPSVLLDNYWEGLSLVNE
jgi:hypothetical protein